MGMFLVSEMDEETDDKNQKTNNSQKLCNTSVRLHIYRSGGSVVNNMLDYQSKAGQRSAVGRAPDS